MRPAWTRVFANYIGTVLQSFNNNSFHTIRAPARFEPESTRDPTATHRLTSQVRGTLIHPHNLPDLLSGRGLTHEGQWFSVSLKVVGPTWIFDKQRVINLSHWLAK
jgi:hypothetical protein